MMAFNNYDNLSLVQLIIILKLFQESCCYENNYKPPKQTSTNNKHKNCIELNNLPIEKSKPNIEYILPIVEINAEDHTASILPKQKLNIKDDTVNILDILDIAKEGDISETTYESIHEINNNNNNNNNNIISTLDIVIAEKNIDISIESIFKLKNPALDIKNMKKDVYLTNSTLLPMYEKHDASNVFNGKLFLEGFIRNKIDFSIAKGINDKIINLDTECVIIYIPFKCTALIPYTIMPIFPEEVDLGYIPVYMSSNFININKDYLEYANKKNTESEEYINCNIPPINCEINEINIHETYTLMDRTPFNSEFPIEMNFHTIKENIVINLSLSLLQKQDVAINYKSPPK